MLVKTNSWYLLQNLQLVAYASEVLTETKITHKLKRKHCICSRKMPSACLGKVTKVNTDHKPLVAVLNKNISFTERIN